MKKYTIIISFIVFCFSGIFFKPQIYAAETKNVDKCGYRGYEISIEKENLETYEPVYYNSYVPKERILKWKSYNGTYYYEKLTDAEKKLWDDLESDCIRVAEGKEDVQRVTALTPLENVSVNEVIDVTNMFRLSHPQYFFLKNRMGYSILDGSKIIPYIYLYDEFQNGITRNDAVKQFLAKIDSWVQEIKKNELDEQKEKCAYEIVCNNTIYEAGTYDQSAYSLVCQGKTVCAGYAATFQMLMNAVGIEALEVISSNHGWNMVKIYNTWYEVDATFGDQNDEVKAGYFYGIDYEYYNKSRNTMGKEKGHVIIEPYSQYIPDTNCDSTTGRRYSYRNPYFEILGNTYCELNGNAQLGNYRAYAVKVTSDNTPKIVTYNGNDWNIDENKLKVIFDVLPENNSVCGDIVKLSASASGEKGSYTYKFLLSDDKGNWYKIRDFDSTSNCEWRTSAAGKKNLYVDAKDKAGVSKRTKVSYEVKPKENLQISLKISPDNCVEVGDKVELIANAKGGSAPYTYSYLLHNKDSDSWFRLTSQFVKDANYTWTAGSIGNREFFVEVKDGTGKVVRSSAVNVETVKTESPLKINAKVSTEVVTVGNSVTVMAEAEGGKKAYMYSYLLHNRDTDSWYRLTPQFVKEASYTWIAGSTGNREFFVEVKDDTGKVVRSSAVNVKTVTAKDPLKIEAKISAEKIMVGQSVTVTAKAIGGTEPYTYSYLLHNKDSDSWYRLTPQFTKEASYIWTAGSKGKREFFIEVKDYTGKVVRSSAVDVEV